MALKRHLESDLTSSDDEEWLSMAKESKMALGETAPKAPRLDAETQSDKHDLSRLPNPALLCLFHQINRAKKKDLLSLASTSRRLRLISQAPELWNDLDLFRPAKSFVKIGPLLLKEGLRNNVTALRLGSYIIPNDQRLSFDIAVNSALNQLLGLRALRELHLQNAGDHVWSILVGLKNLETLVLARRPNMHFKSGMPIFDRIKSLSLVNTTVFGALDDILEHFPALTALSLVETSIRNKYEGKTRDEIQLGQSRVAEHPLEILILIGLTPPFPFFDLYALGFRAPKWLALAYAITGMHWLPGFRVLKGIVPLDREGIMLMDKKRRIMPTSEMLEEGTFPWDPQRIFEKPDNPIIVKYNQRLSFSLHGILPRV